VKKNKRVSKKMSVIAATSMRIGAIIVVSFVMVILYLLSSSSCTQLLKMKGEKVRTIEKLEADRLRASTHWEEMLTPERVEKALRANGLSMKPPKPNQVVRMLANGTPRAGQMSVAAARRRNEGSSASVSVKYRP